MAISAAVCSKLLINFTACFTLSFTLLLNEIFPLPSNRKIKFTKRINDNERIITYCTQFGQPFGMLHRYIKYIAMKYPCTFSIQGNGLLIVQLKST